MKKALITGITGQDGSYLAEFLLEKGYEVHGLVRRSSLSKIDRIEHLFEGAHAKRFFLHYGDLTDSSSILHIMAKVAPDEVYNLAAQSHVRVSFEVPETTALCDAVGVLKLLEAIRTLGKERETRLYQASTSELYGNSGSALQNEETPFEPRSPYAAAKLYAYWIVKNYREAYGIYAVNGILFNHESERRGETFVTRKVTLAVARIANGSDEKILLGNMNAKRDWGHASDYVEMMWLMLQQKTPDDYVVATGESHSVREFVELAFREIGIEIVWDGVGVDEIGRDKATGRTLVAIDPYYFRPTEVDALRGDASKAKRQLGWTPRIAFPELVKRMVANDLKVAHLHKRERRK